MTKEQIIELNKLNDLTNRIIGAAIDVHKELGPGLLESIYETCLIKELALRGIHSESQVELPLYYKGKLLDKNFRIDILVENEIVIELKSVDELKPIHEVQLVSYLKLSNKKLGLLINFNVPLLRDGIKRRVNGFYY